MMTAARPRALRSPKTVDEYLATLDGPQRDALERLRRVLRRAAPLAEECISYGIPTLRLDGRLILSFGAWKAHCAFYPGSIVERFSAELSGYDTGKGTIRFRSDQPLPAALVRRIVKARLIQRVATRRPAQRTPRRSAGAAE